MGLEKERELCWSTENKTCEDSARRWPSASQKSNPVKPWSELLASRTVKKYFCCLSTQSVAFCYGNLSRLRCLCWSVSCSAVYFLVCLNCTIWISLPDGKSMTGRCIVNFFYQPLSYAVSGRWARPSKGNQSSNFFLLGFWSLKISSYMIQKIGKVLMFTGLCKTGKLYNEVILHGI